jgi:CRISPR system Cascade subunit CasD
MRFLLFQLYGPLVSWGDVAVGERRPSSTQPSRSAVLGIVAAALGIRRADADGLSAVNRDLGVAVRVEDAGLLLTDYHTAQVPPTTRESDPRTRIDELASDGLHTVLSTRDYRCDALSFGCIWNRTDAPRWTLEVVAETLRRPTFSLYLGRKTCVPGLPVRPVIVEAKDPVAALRAAKKDSEFLDGFPDGATRSFHWEGDSGGATQTVLRRDESVSRERWQFVERLEHILVEERSRVLEQDPASN